MTNKELLGRLESGLYSLIDGHIYYNNHVVKIRYDLIENPLSNTFQEHQIFDYYYNIFSLAHGEKIEVNCPLESKCMNKLLYIIKNQSQLKVSRFFVVPYLHENRIYLNRKKINTEYFYTTIRQECPAYLFTDQHEKKIYNKIKRNRSIVCINLNESKYYLYSERGVLRHRVNFKKLTQTYGKITQVSQSGQNFLFLDNRDSGPVLSLFSLTEVDFVLIKEIDVMEHIASFREDLLGPKKAETTKKAGRRLEHLLRINSSLLQPNSCSFEYSLNDRMDVIIKVKVLQDKLTVRQKSIIDEQNLLLRQVKRSLDYFQGAIGFSEKAAQLDPTFDTLFFYVSGSSHLPKSKKQSAEQ